MAQSFLSLLSHLNSSISPKPNTNITMGRFLNGLLLGVGVGLLVAPEKGEDIRANLSDATQKWRDQLNRLLGRGGAHLDDLRTFLDSEIEGMNDDARVKISKILDELGPDSRGQQGAGGRAGNGAAEGAGQERGGQRQPASSRQSAQRQEASAEQGAGQRQEARAGQQGGPQERQA